MSQQRENKMVSEKNATEFGDKTYTKIFVGGLAWETQRETMKRYFEQFGEILEAVVINDKTTGRSKGYGFVTFKDADSAMRACQIPYPIIDGRRANCNLASLGAQKSRPALTQHVTGYEKLRPPPRARAPSPYFRQPIPQYAFPYSAYGYPAYPQDIYAMNYYNAYCGQQFPSYYTTGTSGSPGVYLNYYPYAQHGQNSPTQYPKMIQHPYFSQQYQYRAYGILSAPTSASPSLAVTGPATPTVAAAVGVLGTASEPQSSAQLK